LSKEYEIRPYNSGDEVGIAELLVIAYNVWPPHFDLDCTPLDHWLWKYRLNPQPHKLVTVAVDEGRIIGVQNGSYTRTKIGEKIVLLSRGQDSATHPEFRRRGIIKKLTELREILRKEEGISFSLAAPGILTRSYIGRIWTETPFKVIPHVRINNLDKHIKNSEVKDAFRKKIGYYLLKFLYYLRKPFMRSVKFAEYEVKEIEEFDDRINVFWDSIKDHYCFIVERTRDYLNWRYCDPAGGNFVTRIVEDGDKILGYCVLRINKIKKKYPVGFIVDIISLPNRLDVIELLMKDALDYFDRNNVNAVKCWVLEGHPYEKIVKRQGFFYSRIIRPLFYHILSDISDEMLVYPIEKIHFVYGDYDAI
jgi:hypothetical protein